VLKNGRQTEAKNGLKAREWSKRKCTKRRAWIAPGRIGKENYTTGAQKGKKGSGVGEKMAQISEKTHRHIRDGSNAKIRNLRGLGKAQDQATRLCGMV